MDTSTEIEDLLVVRMLLEGGPDDSDIDRDQQIVALVMKVTLVLLLGLIFVVSSVLNTVFLVIFYRKPALRSISNKFIVSLSVVNLVTSWIVLPLVTADTFLTQWDSQVFCLILDTAMELITTLSVFATLAIAIDRYLAIIHPLHYNMLMTRKCMLWMIAISSLLALALTAASALGDLRARPWNVCGLKGQEIIPLLLETWTYRSSFLVINLILSFVIPTVALFGIYLRIYLAAAKNIETTRKNSVSGSTRDSKYSKGSSFQSPARSASTRSTSSQIVSNIRNRFSNASLFLNKEESRAARIAVTVVITFSMCWMPYYIAMFLRTDVMQMFIPREVHQTCILMALSNAVASPYIYLYRSPRIQREVRRLLGLPVKFTRSTGRVSRRRVRPSYLVRIDQSEQVLDNHLSEAKSEELTKTNKVTPLTAFFTKVFHKECSVDNERSSFSSNTSTVSMRSAVNVPVYTTGETSAGIGDDDVKNEERLSQIMESANHLNVNL